MSLQILIPSDSNFWQPFVRFSAAFNVSTANRYDFGLDATQGQVVLDLQKDKVYLVERYNFTMNIPVGDFEDTIDVVPELELRMLNQKSGLIYPQPIPLPTYQQQKEVMWWVKANQPDQLIANFTGQVGQNANMVGKDPLIATHVFNIYEIRSPKWVEAWVKGTDPDFQGFRFRRGGRTEQ